MTIIRPNTCKTCAHCFIVPNPPPNDAPFECRESPPQVSHIPVQNPKGLAVMLQSSFPRIFPDWWCGKYKTTITTH